MQNKKEKKREALFEKYANNLSLLKENGFIDIDVPIDSSIYICPICLDHFTKDDLDQNVKNPLSLEDAPPKSLGGSQIILTCERCNNGLGSDIDWHLTERLKELEFKDKIPGSEQLGTFHIDDLITNGKIVVDNDGTTKAVHPKKMNNPEKLDKFIGIIRTRKKHPLFRHKPSRIDPKKIQIALIKNAYLLMFEKFGYAIILNDEYNRVREQLLKPEKDIYPLNCWFQGPFPEDKIGVPFIKEKNLESIFALFKLKTKLAERIFGVILPLADTKIEDVITALKERFKEEKQFTVDMEVYSDDYLGEIKSIEMLNNWMKNFSSNDA